jgi:Brp/Blh family beta-carotene 15,15'-monooxygenase
MNKLITHQLLFIIFILFFLGAKATIKFDDSSLSYLIWIALFFISSVGVSHGALDGKLIWNGVSKNFEKLILLGIYLILVLLGLALWVFYPVIGLMLLLTMAVFHFGNADLKLFKLNDVNVKLSWGFTVTFLPILFKKDTVELIFYNLIGFNLPDTFIAIIYCILVLSIFRIYWVILNNIIKSNENNICLIDKSVLIFFEITLLITLSYFTHPFVWFAIYFCGLHGIRSLINSDFNWRIDLKWIIIFTLPVIVFIFFTYGKYWNADVYSIIFPILGSLTIAHMSLPSIINSIKK